MKKFILAALVVGVVIVMLNLFQHPWTLKQVQGDDAGEANIVKIALLLPLTGDNAIVGQPVKGAAEIALEDVRKRDTRYNYELIFEDSLSNSAKAATIMSKLTSLDKVDAVVTMFSNVGNVVSASAEKNKVIHIATASDPHVAEGKYNFINWIQPAAESIKMVETIKDKGYKNITMVAINQEGSIAVADELVNQLAEKGIKSSVMKLNPGTRDMRIDIKKAQDAGTDLYVLLIYNPENPIFIRQLRESGYDTDITAVETFNFVEDLNTVEGAWFIDGGSKDNEIMARIKKHNKSENTYAVANVYDDIMLLVDAFEKAPSKEGAVDALANTKDYEGLIGEAKQDEAGIFQSEAVVKKIVNGKMVIED